MADKILFGLISIFLLFSCKKEGEPTVQELLDKGEEISVILEHHPADSLIGKELQGGWIFYVNEAEGSVRIVSNVDMSSQSVWGCAGNPIDGADSTGVGYGKWNTQDIIAECPDANAAAGYCYYSSQGGFTNWMLPSLDELKMVYDMLHATGIGNFSSSESYWTSSEVDEINAWSVDFSTGDSLVRNKTNFMSVRGIRKSDQ